jgi:hypothetical protein
MDSLLLRHTYTYAICICAGCIQFRMQLEMRCRYDTIRCPGVSDGEATEAGQELLVFSGA